MATEGSRNVLRCFCNSDIYALSFSINLFVFVSCTQDVQYSQEHRTAVSVL